MQQEKKNGKRKRYFRGSRKIAGKEKPPEKKEIFNCTLCGKPIRYIYTAIAMRDQNEPAHFDCVLRQLTESEELDRNEKICYLGQGSFGIIRYSGGNGGNSFSIRKRIQIEKSDLSADWRKKMGYQPKDF